MNSGEFYIPPISKQAQQIQSDDWQTRVNVLTNLHSSGVFNNMDHCVAQAILVLLLRNKFEMLSFDFHIDLFLFIEFGWRGRHSITGGSM